MRTTSRRTAALAVLLVGSLLASGCRFDGAYDLPLPGGPVDPDHAFTVTAEFEDILNLVPRSEVKVNDVTVGEVTEVWREGWHAGVEMRIQNGVDLPDNAVALIRQTSLLGEKYVALLPPPGKRAQGELSDGDHLPLAATGRNPEVEEVLGALSFLLNGGGVAQLKTISTELNTVMEGRQERIGHLLGELDTLVGSLDRQKEEIVDAMAAINRLTATLNREQDAVVEAMDTMGPAIAVLADQRRQLMSMLRSLDRLGEVGTRVIEGTRENLLADLRHLRPILRNLNEAGQSLPNAMDLFISFPFPKEASEVVQGDYADTEIAMDLSIDNIVAQLEKRTGRELPLPEVRVPTLPGRPEAPDALDTPELPGLPGDLGGVVGRGGGLLGGGLG
ncbi:MAG TPA: MCE family protein [Nocardioidaceae bacterium]|nr:MCE family protein [Nocardioidaceae bacterium]